jgi:tellurite resistance protein TerC
MDLLQTELWIGFGAVVLIMLALDLGVLNRKAHVISLKEAGIWTAVWIALSLAFGAVIWGLLGPTAGVQFLTGYLIEKSLSVDNIFVFVLIFSYFSVPPLYQHRVLFWGVLGALIMRAIMIGAGVALIHRFEWIVYVFGAFLIYSGIRMARQNHDEEIDPNANPVIRLFRRMMPVTSEYHGEKFTIIQQGKRFATPLLLVLIMIETTDLIFAVDSIPAILAISQDPFIVYTSNIFAILGLRSMYFLLASVIDKFRYLKVGLSIILVYVGAKMLATAVGFHIDPFVSLGIISAILTISVVASLWKNRQDALEEVHAGKHSDLAAK